MGIDLNFLRKSESKDTRRSFTYSDLTLDIELDSDQPTSPVNASKNPYDVKLDYDERAIVNSIFNIFNTKPGQKILNPTFGLDLSEFLFDPISEETARLIGDKVKKLPQQEPRVQVSNIKVYGITSDNTYQIQFTILIPSLNTTVNINSVQTQTEFKYI